MQKSSCVLEYISKGLQGKERGKFQNLNLLLIQIGRCSARERMFACNGRGGYELESPVEEEYDRK